MSLNIELDKLLPILTVFTFAAIRLGPITHSILASKSVVWNTFYAIDVIQEQINELKKFNFDRNNFQPLELLAFNKKINFKDCFFKFNNKLSFISLFICGGYNSIVVDKQIVFIKLLNSNLDVASFIDIIKSIYLHYHFQFSYFYIDKIT